MVQAVQEDVSSADNDHILLDLLSPEFHSVRSGYLITTKPSDVVVKIALEDLILLEYQRNLIDLLGLSVNVTI